MKTCEVTADRVSLICGKGSIVVVDDIQFELAKRFLKPVEQKKRKATKKSTEEE